MSLPGVVQARLAEKLTILNERAEGLLARLHYIKKELDTKGSPAYRFLDDRQLDPAVKFLQKSFPNCDAKAPQVANVNALKSAVIQLFSPFYFTLVDVLEFKDHVSELLAICDSQALTLDIEVNFDLTQNYLNLVVGYASVMLMVSRIEDRKVMPALFNLATLMQTGKAEPSFPRLGQVILDFESPMKKLGEDFVPHARTLLPAVMSLKSIYYQRSATAKKLRDNGFLQIFVSPDKMAAIFEPDQMRCEVLHLQVIEKWIIMGLLLTYQKLSEEGCWSLMRDALRTCYILELYRNEVLYVHSFIHNFLDTVKGFNSNKQLGEIREIQTHALKTCPAYHKERRDFVRSELHCIVNTIRDQPGLLGPKVLLVLQGVVMARDEVVWLLHHAVHQTSKMHSTRVSKEDLVDKQLPELLHLMEEMKGLVTKYRGVVERYYRRYLSGADLRNLQQLSQSVSGALSQESSLLDSLADRVKDLASSSSNLPDLQSLELDWFRFQAYTSVRESGCKLREAGALARCVNKVVLHACLLGDLDFLLVAAGNLSVFCFYPKVLEFEFQQSLRHDFPPQQRYSIVFATLCSQFLLASHDLCPEDREVITMDSIHTAERFLHDLSHEANDVIGNILSLNKELSQKLHPGEALNVLLDTSQLPRSKRKKKQKQLAKGFPGQESHRKTREEFSKYDYPYAALTELCTALRAMGSIQVADQTLIPKEIFVRGLESRFMQAIQDLLRSNSEAGEIILPSEALAGILGYLNVLQIVADYVDVDVSKVMTTVLQQETHPMTYSGAHSVTGIYTKWFVKMFVQQSVTSHVTYSPRQRAFVILPVTDSASFPPVDEYACIKELEALVDLTGAVGVHYLMEHLMGAVADQVDEIKKVVNQNKEILTQMRSYFDHPAALLDLAKRLQGTEVVFRGVLTIGMILSLKCLTQEALSNVLEVRVPAIMACIHSLVATAIKKRQTKVVSDLAASVGLPTRKDASLVNALKARKADHPDAEYRTSCLLVVFLAATLPRLARKDCPVYRHPMGAGHINMSRCYSLAVNTLTATLLNLQGPTDVEERMREFVVISASLLLKLGHEDDPQVMKNRDFVYLLLNQIIEECPYIKTDFLWRFFPYDLVRRAHQMVTSLCPQAEL